MTKKKSDNQFDYSPITYGDVLYFFLVNKSIDITAVSKYTFTERRLPIKKALWFFCFITVISSSSSFLMAQWIQTSGPEGGMIECLAIRGSYLFAGTEGGVYRSTDNGSNWTQAGLRQNHINALTVIGDQVFAGTWGGVFFLRNKSDNWTAVNRGLKFLGVPSLVLSGSNPSAYPWTIPDTTSTNCLVRKSDILDANINDVSDSYFSIESLPDGIIITEIGLPKKHSLLQNYPSPFNPSTKMKFALPNINIVKIELYNTIGQRVEILLNQQMKTGQHKIEFNGKNISSGVYYYRIQAGEFQDVKKMILLR